MIDRRGFIGALTTIPFLGGLFANRLSAGEKKLSYLFTCPGCGGHEIGVIFNERPIFKIESVGDKIIVGDPVVTDNAVWSYLCTGCGQWLPRLATGRSPDEDLRAYLDGHLKRAEVLVNGDLYAHTNFDDRLDTVGSVRARWRKLYLYENCEIRVVPWRAWE